ncbi:T9SS type A sorting domain-containing protein [Kordia sp.]|uniref:T9SS type A sorting domain-containing protein n=1 Tax=Kordia sp. TaxID=1965332 RepID=UPI0025BEAC75|nr:T9SS type A sorting domain-containing protein [Kordia sp.]MCH2195070.1 T9SS type A sorting domain-containing protein [Kordia sp.]
MKKITLLILLLSSFVTFGQVNLDFEDGTTTVQFTFNGVGAANVANSQMNTDNMSSRVLEVTKPAGAEWFSGCGFQSVAGTPFVSMADGDQFTVKIWSSKANVPFRVRLQTDLDAVANTAYNYDFVITTANQWVEYTLDFSGVVNGTEQYREIVIQPDFDPACEGGGCGPIAVGGTYLIDDFVQVTPTVDPNTDATLSDLTVNGTTVTGFSPNTFTYNVELPNGSGVPTVAGTASQAGSGASNVSITQASMLPDAATLNVTAPDGIATQLYTVNFTEAPALPPAAPTPTVPAISIISDVYTNISTPQVDVFGGSLTNLDLNGDMNEEARLITGGSGFQFNYFPGSAFVDISAPDMMHLDIYCDNIADGDVLRIRLLGSDTSIANIARVTLNSAQSGTWVGVDLAIPDGTNRNDFGDIDSGATSIDVTDLALIQINTLDLGSTLAGKDVYLSNIYFYGGTLSTPEFNAASFKTYPNPTRDAWNVVTDNVTINAIEVYDISGRQVITMNPNVARVTIDGTYLKSGIYFAKISTDSGASSIKLVKN